MKDKFLWYFKPGDAEIKKIWNKGLLTLDANVLLDLYRYHEDTRKKILSSINSFEGRLWLSHQAAEEFFRNRAKVIVGASNGFNQAIDELGKISKSLESNINKLRNNKIVAKESVEKLNNSLLKAIKQAQKEIDAAHSVYPNYIAEDPILPEILKLFDGVVGESFDENRLKAEKTEGERRKKCHIPPGYLDDGKDGDKPYGDYFMWRQILDHAKSVGRPIILVTSEDKDDWWERPSGQTIGPRQELLKEAHEQAGQRVLIYRTENFATYAAELEGRTVDESFVEEIRAVDRLRVEPELGLMWNWNNKVHAYLYVFLAEGQLDERQKAKGFDAIGLCKLRDLAYWNKGVEANEIWDLKLKAMAENLDSFFCANGAGYKKRQNREMVIPTLCRLFDKGSLYIHEMGEKCDAIYIFN